MYSLGVKTSCFMCWCCFEKEINNLVLYIFDAVQCSLSRTAIISQKLADLFRIFSLFALAVRFLSPLLLLLLQVFWCFLHASAYHPV